ncbi:MAG: orotidine-5'-phosphate decarboxylase [Inquilinus sp.]|nr:orotidine-5'-phosphate decarboxylase [Inquilinus sp.]
MTDLPNPIFCALDTPTTAGAVELGRTVAPHVGGLKLGLEFFMAAGPAGVRAVAEIGRPVFLDLKLHDIPNTVAGAIRSVVPLAPAFITLHASGGPAMMRAALDAAHETAASANLARPRLLGVTVLTSLDAEDLSAVGQDDEVARQVGRLATLARAAGLDGVVCAPGEIARLRAQMGPEFGLMVPGIRPAGAGADDQKRVMTPQQAMAAGADHLVIGRPITRAADPAEAARHIAESLRHDHP